MKNTIIQKFKNVTFVLLAIVLFGLILRLIEINRDFTFDEAYTILLTKNNSVLTILKGLSSDNAPPLFFLVMFQFQKLVFSTYLLRLLPLMLGILDIILIYIVGEKLFNRSVGIFGALFTSVMPIAIYNSQNIRMYTFGFILSSLLLYSFIALIKNAKTKFCLHHGIFLFSLMLGFFTHYYFIFFVPALIIILAKQNSRIKRKILLLILISITIFTPWALKALSTSHASVITANRLLKIPLIFINFIVGLDQIGISQHNYTFYPRSFILIIILSLFILVILVSNLKKIILENDTYMLFILAAIPSITTIVLSYTIFPVIALHGYFLFSPAFFLLLGYLFSTYKLKIKLVLTITFLFLGASTHLSLIYNAPHHLQKASAILRKNFIEGDQIIYGDVIPMAQMLVYFPHSNQYLLKNNPALEIESAKAIGIMTFDATKFLQNNRIWYIYEKGTYRRSDAEEFEVLLDQKHSYLLKTLQKPVKIILYNKK